MNTSRKAHWENVYATKESATVSWYQPVPEKSLELIRSTDVALQDAILDVGGGARVNGQISVKDKKALIDITWIK